MTSFGTPHLFTHRHGRACPGLSGLVPAIHVLKFPGKDVDARHKPGMTSMGASITYRCSGTWRLDSLRLLIRLRVLETVKKSRRETLPADRSMT